jgi:hypothetical protein
MTMIFLKIGDSVVNIDDISMIGIATETKFHDSGKAEHYYVGVSCKNPVNSIQTHRVATLQEARAIRDKIMQKLVRHCTVDESGV